MDYRIVCTRCVHEEDQKAFRCSRCNSILEVRFDYSDFSLPSNFRSRRISASKYLDFMPISKIRIRGGEGGTPFVRKGSGNGIMLKPETENPTHSFKDRGSVIEINKALELGFGEVCCASTGNMGISVSRYAKLAGIKSTIFLSRDADRKKIGMISKYGADIVKISGDFNKALVFAEKFALRTGVFVCGDYHYRKEGQKSVAYEIIEQMKYHVPDFVFIPVGNATLLSAMYKGLVEFERFGLIRKLPKLVAVQSKKCDPLVRAYIAGKRITYIRPGTIANAIAVGYPTFGFEGIEALKLTKGIGIAVSEDEIKSAVNNLAGLGIKSETGGAAGFAGYERLLKEDGSIGEKKSVIVVTGSN